MNNFKIFFGNKNTAIFSMRDKILEEEAPELLAQRTKNLDIFDGQPKYIFLHQTHTDKGYLIKKLLPSFSIEGDFLMTQEKSIAISILTADCLPIIFYDREHHAAAIIHAGWKGSVKKILQKAFLMMKESFDSKAEMLQVFLGPCAKKCCYEVQKDFAQEFKDNILDQTIIQENNKLKFDNVLYTQLELEKLGIKKEHINIDFNECTVCNPLYGSFRRLKDDSPLNISSICLY